MGRPIERAEKRARGDDRIGRRELAAADTAGYERADAMFVAIPFGHDERTEAAGEGVDLTEKQQLVLTAKVVVEVARRQVGFDGNLAHAGGCEAPGAKDTSGRSQNAHAAGIGTT